MSVMAIRQLTAIMAQPSRLAPTRAITIPNSRTSLSLRPLVNHMLCLLL